MTLVDMAFFNSDHGGLRGATSRGSRAGDYDFTRLVRVMGDGGRWPDFFVLAECDYYEFFGGTGMWGAAAAFQHASGRPYIPLLCTLPHRYGAFAPMYFLDADRLTVTRFFDPRAIDASARNDNVLEIRADEEGPALLVSTTHGDLWSPVWQCYDAYSMRWLANPALLSVILADWNSPLSGPQYQPGDLDDLELHDNRWQIEHRLARGADGATIVPRRLATLALDALCGRWDDVSGRRVDGIGFHDCAELAGVTAGTNIPPAHRPFQSWQPDHILVNASLATRMVPGSFQIHEPIDPEQPDSDHKRLSVTVDL